MTIESGRSSWRLIVVPDAASVGRRAAELIGDEVEAAVRTRGVAHVALAGGSTPAGMFRVLAAPPLRDELPWDRVHLWWGDDRFVPRDDPRSNVWIADRYLLSGEDGGPGIPIPLDHVHPFRCSEALYAGRDADSCAAEYAAELHAAVPADDAGWPVLDLVVVGVGPDGHLLSVFPGSAAFDRSEWAVGVPAPTHIEPHVPRVTLNPAIVGAARAVLAVVQGAVKAAIVVTVFGTERDPRRWPAQLALRPGATWVLDGPAASLLPFELPASSLEEPPVARSCSHLDQVRHVIPSAEGCEDCLRIGGQWVHLRLCLSCGHVGCCDQSPNRHATEHHQATGHPIIRSFEPGEAWAYCYPDDEFFEELPA